MPKASKQGSTSSTPFQFARQFTAPPFFVGLEGAKLKSRLLLNAVAGSRKAAAAPPKTRKVTAKKSSAKAKARKK